MGRQKAPVHKKTTQTIYVAAGTVTQRKRHHRVENRVRGIIKRSRNKKG